MRAMDTEPGIADADGTTADVTGTDVVCLGETMVVFLPTRAGRLADVPSFDRAVGGAESNVACALASAGHRARWLGRVGADGFGDHLLEALAGRGVDVGRVERDPYRPTGVYFRTDGERPTGLADAESSAGAPAGDPTGSSPGGASEVVYYRAGSAASAMSTGTVDLAAADSGRVLHLSGITAALSPDCLGLMRRLTGPRPMRPLVSFDVNFRMGLWRTAPEAPSVLLELARGCDLVFVGEDEAEAAWGVGGAGVGGAGAGRGAGGAAAVRAALPEPAVLVVKDGGAGATAYLRGSDGRDVVVSVPAPRVEVVAPVGAGDAFAAGFLSGTLRGRSVRERLRSGHLAAAAALTEPGDLARMPAPAEADRLAALDDAAWSALRLQPGWTADKGESADSGRTADKAEGSAG